MRPRLYLADELSAELLGSAEVATCYCLLLATAGAAVTGEPPAVDGGCYHRGDNRPVQQLAVEARPPPCSPALGIRHDGTRREREPGAAERREFEVRPGDSYTVYSIQYTV